MLLSRSRSSGIWNPSGYWGDDVFNAARYPYGFLTANPALLFVWSVIYPVALFAAVHMTVSAEIVGSRLIAAGDLKLDFLNSDRCGGLSRFGTMNALIMLIYLWPCGALFALHLTHRYTYTSLMVGAMSISVILTLQSVYGLYWIARLIASERQRTVATLNAQIDAAMRAGAIRSNEALLAMAYRDHVMAVSSYPYSIAVSRLVNVLRYSPAAVATARAVLAHLINAQ